MAKLKILTGKDNKILRAESAKVAKVEKKTRKFIDDMIQTLKDSDGLGLAAPQVGENKRIIIVRLNYDTMHEMIMPLINPEVVYSSVEKEVGEEGCLSLPGEFGQVQRSKIIRVKFLDISNMKQVMELEGLNARIVQHETDHLDGILFVDYLPKTATESK